MCSVLRLLVTVFARGEEHAFITSLREACKALAACQMPRLPLMVWLVCKARGKGEWPIDKLRSSPTEHLICAPDAANMDFVAPTGHIPPSIMQG